LVLRHWILLPLSSNVSFFFLLRLLVPMTCCFFLWWWWWWWSWWLTVMVMMMMMMILLSSVSFFLLLISLLSLPSSSSLSLYFPSSFFPCRHPCPFSTLLVLLLFNIIITIIVVDIVLCLCCCRYSIINRWIFCTFYVDYVAVVEQDVYYCWHSSFWYLFPSHHCYSSSDISWFVSLVDFHTIPHTIDRGNTWWMCCSHSWDVFFSFPSSLLCSERKHILSCLNPVWMCVSVNE